MDGPVRRREQARDRRPVVEVGHDRRCAAGRDDVRLGVVTDKRGHVVAMLSQFGQYMGADEPCCTGEYDFHGRTPSCLGGPSPATLGDYDLNGQVNSLADAG